VFGRRFMLAVAIIVATFFSGGVAPAAVVSPSVPQGDIVKIGTTWRGGTCKKDGFEIGMFITAGIYQNKRTGKRFIWRQNWRYRTEQWADPRAKLVAVEAWMASGPSASKNYPPKSTPAGVVHYFEGTGASTKVSAAMSWRIKGYNAHGEPETFVCSASLLKKP
jgi:hypothetical protein